MSYAPKHKVAHHKLAAGAVAGAAAPARQAAGFVDNRPAALVQRKLGKLIQESPRVAAQATQAAAVQAKAAPVPNRTGMPDRLKSGIESLSGMSMDHVKVHYNSSRPAQLQAHAYAQGSEIHLAPGQEAHLPHEAWHVVQQAQGRVKPTMQMKSGLRVNDDVGLEREADLMGGRALSELNSTPLVPAPAQRLRSLKHTPVHQLLTFYHGGGRAFVESAIQKPHAGKSSEGELGSGGMYYWKDDEDAALFTAITYNKSLEWAVMKIETNNDVGKASEKTTSALYFADATRRPQVRYQNEKFKYMNGINYTFLQNNLSTKLANAKEDPSIEGELDPDYLDLTGRQFLDKFDVVIAPTKAEKYKHKVLQTRVNDKGLTDLIYGENGDSKNVFSKTWEGCLDEEQTKTVANMKFEGRHEVPKVVLGFKGAKVKKF